MHAAGSSSEAEAAKLEPLLGGLLFLLSVADDKIQYSFDGDEELLDEQLPPLPTGHCLRLRTLAADGDNFTGGRVWHSAPVLCRWMAEHSHSHLHGRRVLDLGSGTGACGLYASGLGAQSVVLSDGAPRLLELLQYNVEANQSRIGSRVDVMQLEFGQSAHALPHGPPIELVLGSDVIYDAASHCALCRTLSALLKRDRPRIVLATMPRSHTRLSSGASDAQPLYTETALSLFATEAQSHGLRVMPALGLATQRAASVDDSSSDQQAILERDLSAFAWTAAEFRDAVPFVFEVVDGFSGSADAAQERPSS
jgi:predicted nicotinamide N-methyase